MIQAYGIISTHVRIVVTNQAGKGYVLIYIRYKTAHASLVHGSQSSRVLATNGNKSVRENISNVFGTKTASQLVPFTIGIPFLREDSEDSQQ